MSVVSFVVGRAYRKSCLQVAAHAVGITLVFLCLLPPILSSSRPVEGRREALALLAEGQEALRSGRIGEALQALERSVEIAPSPAAYYNLSQAYRKTGRRAEAVVALEKALELNPEYELAKQALREIGDTKTARRQERINFDSTVNEQETLESLRQPDESPQQEAKPTILAVGALLPKPPKLLGGAKPTIPASSPTAPTGSVRDAVIPSQPVEIVNEVPAREIVTAGTDIAKRRGYAATRSDEPSKLPGTRLPVFSLWRGKKETTAPATKNSIEQSRTRSTRSDGQPKRAKTESVASAPAASDVKAINQAAFSEETDATQQQPKRFGNPGKILLGTFAFHREKGDNYRKAQRWIEAADEYQLALEKNPDDAETRALLAECLARAGEVDVAEEQFRRALAMDPNDPKVLFRMGNTYRELKRYDAAIKAYRQALGADPNNATVRNNLGVVYMESGAYAKAAEEFKKVLQINPRYDKAALNLGILYEEHLDDPQKALQYYSRYIEMGGPRAKEVQKWLDDLSSRQ
ncbi:MAG: tetratricopeptide repeat protein [Candidatus Sumerlaeaceae bacterium]|nr:tetratricopeptide repeat protein [Candidatus Sumerlaeaceae bacterium]